jgi:hypothetical protein
VGLTLDRRTKQASRAGVEARRLLRLASLQGGGRFITASAGGCSALLVSLVLGW